MASATCGKEIGNDKRRRLNKHPSGKIKEVLRVQRKKKHPQRE
jgi:hypothetical protein